MTDKPLSQFERRSQNAPVPPTRSPQASPKKRSPQVVLLLMGTMAVGSTAYMLMPRECKPAQPGAVSMSTDCPPSSSSTGHTGSGSSSRSSYYSGGSSSTDSSSVKRGGFGSSAQAFSSHFSFGG